MKANMAIGLGFVVAGALQIIYAKAAGDLNVKMMRWQLRVMETIFANPRTATIWSRIAGTIFILFGAALWVFGE